MARDVTKTKLKLEPYQVILRPMVTEKGFHKAERYNQYTFEVDHRAALKKGYPHKSRNNQIA